MTSYRTNPLYIQDMSTDSSAKLCNNQSLEAGAHVRENMHNNEHCKQFVLRIC